jgi:hypothetical protein
MRNVLVHGIRAAKRARLGKNDRVTSVWLVRSDSVDSCIANDQVVVRFPIEDVTGLDPEDVLAQLPSDLASHDRQRVANEIKAFANSMQIGDVVVLPDKSRNQYLVGRVNGNYEWLDHHVRNIDWMSSIGWEAVPVEYKSIANYQRVVLQVNDASLIETCNEAMESRREKPQLLSLKPATTRRASTPRKRTISPPKPGKVKPESQERLCVSCGLKKHVTQFSGASEYCVDCE